MQIEEAVEQWLIALNAEGRRPATLETYRWHLTLVQRTFAVQGVSALNDISPTYVRQWLVHYGTDHAPASVLSTFKSLRAFLRWCQAEELLKGNPLRNVRTPVEPQVAKDTYSLGELRALFAVLERERTPIGLRDAALIAILADTGLRATEACFLTLSDLAMDSLIARRTKAHRPRTVPLGRRSSALLGRYLARGRPKLQPKGEWLFVADKGGQLTGNAIRCMLNRLSDKVGFHLGAHRSRHTWATAVARAGVNAPTLMALAGWSDIRMAQKYVHLSGQDLRAAHERAKPLDGIG